MEPGQELRLVDRERGAARGHGVREPARVEPHHVEIPLRHDRLPGFAHSRPRDRKPVEKAPLPEDGRLGRVQVLGLILRHDRPRAESGDLSRRGRDREQDSIPEPVVVSGPIAAPDDESGLLQHLRGE